MNRLKVRLERLTARLPPPLELRAGLSDAELRKLPTAELWRRFQRRMETPEALAFRDRLRRMSDEELLRLWQRKA